MTLSIKNMVCPRCIAAVHQLFESEGLRAEVSLGSAILEKEISADEKERIASLLLSLGFELLNDKETVTVERIRNLIVTLVHERDNALEGTLSNYISKNLNHDYTSLSQLFSQVAGMTIEHFYILQKIERVKELLSYGEDNLNEISDRLQYSSPSHLSRQFRQITGMTPTEFRKTHPNHRRSLDTI